MRIQAVFGIGLSALATLVWNTQANADESVVRARQIAETTALVYFKENVSEKERKSVLDDMVFNLSAANKSEIAVTSDWFVSEIPFNQAIEAANQEKYKNVIDHVERNSVVYNFSLGCQNNPQTLPSAFVPEGVSRVGGPFVSASGLAVWIVDTGVEVTGPYLPGIDFNQAGNCVGVTSCTQITTATKDQVADQNGHGTMLAGIIAATPKNSKGPTGVAPSAIIIPVKITNDDTINKADLEKGIDFVADHANPGDVVNLSWGFRVPTPPDDENEWKDNHIEDKLRALAHNGIRVVVAAGNWNPNVPELYLTGGNVQLISPARIGSDIPTAASGAQGGIFTISAVRNDDSFWKDPVSGSFFGNDPPTYAAPGVDIQSLWYMPDKIQTCSGTSFAAAHVSGVLLQDKAVLPATDGTAQGDPSAFDSNNNPVPSQMDPIAICRKTVNTCQPVNH